MPTAGSPEVVLSTRIAGAVPFATGKVRDVYDLGDRLLIVATDRISAFDCVLPTGIPDKGRVLNQLSAYWFELLGDRCPNHCLSIETADIMAALGAAGCDAPEDIVAGRSMLVRKARPIAAEFVVRGYLEGSGWKEYQASGSICGIPLPAGLRRSERLPEPILTPSTKATTGHDLNISHEELLRLDDPAAIHTAVQLALGVYTAAAAFARERGILIADTKFEFGILDGTVIMIDECLTPDSSRFWDAAAYSPGQGQQSLDKQFVRDYLDRTGWDHEPPAPELPADVVRQTGERYREIFRRLTGKELL